MAMALRVETRVGLQVRGADVDPDWVAERLDLTPSASHRRGDPASAEDPSVRRVDGWCYFTSRGDVAPAEPFELHAAWMLERLERQAPMLASWVARGWKVQLEVVTMTNATNGGPTVEAGLLQRIADLGLTTHWRTVCVS